VRPCPAMSATSDMRCSAATPLCCQPPPPVSHYCRHPFKLAQDPNSQHLGTTVWDSSIVLAKYLEKVRRCRTHAHGAAAAVISVPV